MENLKEWSCVMKQRMARFDDAVERLKGAIINVKKKEQGRTKHKKYYSGRNI